MGLGMMRVECHQVECDGRKAGISALGVSLYKAQILW